MSLDKSENSVDVLYRYFRNAEQAVKSLPFQASVSTAGGVSTVNNDSGQTLPSLTTLSHGGESSTSGSNDSFRSAKRPRLGCDSSCNFIRSIDASYCVCPIHDIAIDGAIDNSVIFYSEVKNSRDDTDKNNVGLVHCKPNVESVEKCVDSETTSKTNCKSGRVLERDIFKAKKGDSEMFFKPVRPDLDSKQVPRYKRRSSSKENEFGPKKVPKSLPESNFRSKSVPLYGKVVVNLELSPKANDDFQNCDSSDDEMIIDLARSAMLDTVHFLADDVNKVLEDLIISVTEPVKNDGNSSEHDTEYESESAKLKSFLINNNLHESAASELTAASGDLNTARLELKFKKKRDCLGNLKIVDKSLCSNHLLSNNMNHDSHHLSVPINMILEHSNTEDISNLKNPNGVNQESDIDTNLKNGALELANKIDLSLEGTKEFSANSQTTYKANIHSSQPKRDHNFNLSKNQLKNLNSNPLSNDAGLNDEKYGPLSETNAQEMPLSIESKFVAMLNEQINIVCSMEENVAAIGLCPELKYSLFRDTPTSSPCSPQTCDLKGKLVGSEKHSSQSRSPEQQSLPSKEITHSSSDSTLQTKDFKEIILSDPNVNASCNGNEVLEYASGDMNDSQSSNAEKAVISASSANNSQICSAKDAVISASNANDSHTCSAKEAVISASNANDSQICSVKKPIASASCDGNSKISSLKEAFMLSSNADNSKICSSKEINVSVSDESKVISSEGALMSSSNANDSKISTPKEINVCVSIANESMVSNSKKALMPLSNASDSKISNLKETITSSSNANDSRISSFKEINVFLHDESKISNLKEIPMSSSNANASNINCPNEIKVSVSIANESLTSNNGSQKMIHSGSNANQSKICVVKDISINSDNNSSISSSKEALASTAFENSSEICHSKEITDTDKSQVSNSKETLLSASNEDLQGCNSEEINVTICDSQIHNLIETIPSASNASDSKICKLNKTIQSSSNDNNSLVCELKDAALSNSNHDDARICELNEAVLSTTNTNDSQICNLKETILSISKDIDPQIRELNGAIPASSNAKDSQISELNATNPFANDVNVSQICKLSETNPSITSAKDSPSSKLHETIESNDNDAQICDLNEAIPCSSSDKNSQICDLNEAIPATSDAKDSETCKSNETSLSAKNSDGSKLCKLNETILSTTNANDSQIIKLNETNSPTSNANGSETCKLNETILSTTNANDSLIIKLNETNSPTSNANGSETCKLNETIPPTSNVNGPKVCQVNETNLLTSNANGSQICNMNENSPSTCANPSLFSNSKRTLIPPSVVRKIMSGEGFMLRKSPAQEFSLLQYDASEEQHNLKSQTDHMLPRSVFLKPKSAEAIDPKIPEPKPPVEEPKKTETICTSALDKINGFIPEPVPADVEPNNEPATPEEEPKVLVQTLPVMSLSIGGLGHFSSDQKLKSPNIRSTFSPKHLAATILQENVTHEKRVRKKKVLFDLEEPEPCSSKGIKIRHRIHGLNFHVKKGRGIKLKHIGQIRINLEIASPSMLRILHYVLFGIYGQDRTDNSRIRTIRNILQFSGFPFSECSQEFEKKHICLSRECFLHAETVAHILSDCKVFSAYRIPLPVLVEIQSAVMGKSDGMRCEIVDKLLAFFMAPEKIASERMPGHHENLEETSYADFDRLKDHILNGPEAVVVLERLKGSEIDEMAKNVQSLTEEGTSSRSGIFKYCKPHFIFNGPGVTLKKMLKVRRHVFRARKEVISLVHFILYGRTENLSEMRRNILEFNGFSEIQKEFAETQPIILSCLTYTELQQICDVLSIYATGCSRRKRVNKILKFLHSPTHPPDLRSRLERRKRKVLRQKAKLDSENTPASSKSKSEPTTALKLRSDSVSSKSKDEVPSPTSNESQESKKKDARPESSDTVTLTAVESEKPATRTEPAGVATGSQSESLPKLGDFAKIRENVECATPKDLLELNDLLLLNPSDECEIHQNILQSTQFTFAENSVEFRARKVVLNYLPLETIKKVARLLDIRNCEKISTKEELSTSILKFLTNMVQGSVEENQDSEISSTAYIHRLPSNSLKNSTLYTNIQPVYFSPTDEELEGFISRVVTSGLWSCKDEDLMELVLQQYPVINLEEKEKLIKKKAKEILLRTKKRAFDSLAKTEECWYSKPGEDSEEFIDVMT